MYSEIEMRRDYISDMYGGLQEEPDRYMLMISPASRNGCSI